MASSSVAVITQQQTRDLLSLFAKNPRLVKFFEAIGQDLSINVPSAMDELQSVNESTRSVLFLVNGIAEAALEIAREAYEAPSAQAQAAEADEAPVQPLPVIEAFPIGAIYTSTVATDPAIALGYGTWAAFGAGEFLVGYAAGDPNFGTPGGTGGSKTLAIDNHTSHTHDVTSNVIAGSATFTADAAGASALTSLTNNTVTSTAESATLTHKSGGVTPMPIIPPYVTVYFWKRTA